MNLEEIFQGSDRAAAIVGAAQVEDQLKQSIRQSLRGDQDIFDRLFGVSGAIGNFGAQIDLAFLMRIVDEDTQKDLKDISRIRNEFAHQQGRIGFDEQVIRDRCFNLRIVKSRLISSEDERERVGQTYPDLEALIADFRFSVPDVAATLADPRSLFIASIFVIGGLLQLRRAGIASK